MQPEPSPSGGHLAGIVGPEAERICPCMTIEVSSEAIAARFEDRVDLVMGYKETLRLSWRFKSAHDFLPSPRRPVAAFYSIVKPLVGTVIGSR